MFTYNCIKLYSTLVVDSIYKIILEVLIKIYNIGIC